MKETILVDDEYFKELIQDIRAAEKTIDLEVYIFSEDEMGNAVADALIFAAGKGVKIRLLLDGIGARNAKNLCIKIEEAGVRVRFYHPLFWTLFQKPYRLHLFKNLLHYIWHINSRNHRKTCMIDEKIVYIGSANIEQYANPNDKKKWHDVTVKMENDALDELLFAFEKAWQCVSFKNKYKQIFPIQLDPLIRLNYSWRKRRNLYKSLLVKIDKAQTRIYIASAYFVPRRFLLLKLMKAAKRGLDIRLIIPKNPDVMTISLLMSSFYHVLLKSGVKIFHHNEGILHAKFIIIDHWFCVGSSNLNFRSFHYDLEADVRIQTDSAKNELEDLFNEYCSQSKAVTMNDIERQSFLEKIAIKFLWQIRFLF